MDCKSKQPISRRPAKLPNTVLIGLQANTRYEAVVTVNDRHIPLHFSAHELRRVNDMWNILSTLHADDNQIPHPAIALDCSSPPALAARWSVLKPKAFFGSEPNNGRQASISYVVHRVAYIGKNDMHGCLSGWLIFSPQRWISIKPPSSRLEMR